MNPQTAKKLMSDIPEMQEFVEFLSAKAQELNNLADIPHTSAENIALEVRGRWLAHEKLLEILHPLVTIDMHTSGENTMKEYVV